MCVKIKIMYITLLPYILLLLFISAGLAKQIYNLSIKTVRAAIARPITLTTLHHQRVLLSPRHHRPPSRPVSAPFSFPRTCIDRIAGDVYYFYGFILLVFRGGVLGLGGQKVGPSGFIVCHRSRENSFTGVPVFLPRGGKRETQFIQK